MCDPVTATAAAMTAGGGYLQGRAQQRTVSETNRQQQAAQERSIAARGAERTRQQGFTRQSEGAWQGGLDQLGREGMMARVNSHTGDFVRRLNDTSAAAGNAFGFELPTQAQGSDVVRSRSAAIVNRHAADSAQRVAALAKLTGFGGAMSRRAQTIGSTGDALQQLNGLRRGSLAVADQEQTIPAAQVHHRPSVLGQLLSGAGQVIGMAGGFPGLGGATSSAPVTAIRPQARPPNLIG